MRGLFVKDLELALQQKKFFLVLLVVGILLNLSTDGSFAAGYFTFVCAMFLTSTISYDEYENGFSFLLTLPVRRKDYVAEKYLFGMALTGAAWSVGTAIELLCRLFQEYDISPMEMIASSVIMLFVAFLIIAFMVPFLLKYGNEKGRYISLGVMGACFAVVYLAAEFLKSKGIRITEMLDSLSNAGILTIMAIVGIGALAVYGISYLISLAVMKKKEY